MVLYELHYKLESAVFIPLLMLILIPLFPKLEMWKYGRKTPVGVRILLAIMWCVTLLVSVVVYKSQFEMYNAVITAYNSGDYEIVEGYVENFDPMPPEGHKTESFDIEGVHFSYSDYSVMTGYHNAKSKGGVITGNGQHLKIGYIYYKGHGNVIVYIEETLAESSQ